MSSLRSSALPGTFGSGSLASWMVSRGRIEIPASAAATVPAAIPGRGVVDQRADAERDHAEHARGDRGDEVVIPAPIRKIAAEPNEHDQAAAQHQVPGAEPARPRGTMNSPATNAIGSPPAAAMITPVVSAW